MLYALEFMTYINFGILGYFERDLHKFCGVFNMST